MNELDEALEGDLEFDRTFLTLIAEMLRQKREMNKSLLNIERLELLRKRLVVRAIEEQAVVNLATL